MHATFAVTLCILLCLQPLVGAANAAPLPQDSDEGPPACTATHCGWFAANVPFGIQQSEPSLKAVAYADAQSVATVGFGGTILYSSDGGVNWTVVPSPLPNVTMNTLLRLPSGLLLAGGDYGDMIASEDGGASWYNYYPSGLEGNVTQMGFLSTFFGWASTTAGLFSTNNAGLSWARMNTPVPGQVLAAGFWSTSEGWIDAGLTPAVYYTNNTGATWTEDQSGFGILYASSIEATGPQSAWLLTDTGTIYILNSVATNAYSKVTFDVDLEDLGAYFTVNLPDAWMTASIASIFYTSDAGKCWVQEAVPNPKFVYALAFENSSAGVATGDGFVWYTHTGGLSANDTVDDDTPGCDVEAPPTLPGWTGYAVEAGVAGIALIVFWRTFRAPPAGSGKPPSEAAIRAQKRKLKLREGKRYVEFH